MHTRTNAAPQRKAQRGAVDEANWYSVGVSVDEPNGVPVAAAERASERAPDAGPKSATLAGAHRGTLCVAVSEPESRTDREPHVFAVRGRTAERGRNWG